MDPAQRVNEHGQPIGEALPGWAGARYPDVTALDGAFCRVARLDPAKHAGDLFEAFGQDRTGAMWTYLSYGPFASQDALAAWLDAAAQNADQVTCAIVPAETGRATGVATYMRIQPADGVVEVGGIAMAPGLQKTRAATEAMFLMMRYAFEECGYRRYEWKCDALNAPSRRAAERLGFTYDGLFRQAVIYRGRNRDTAWYSILDRDWPAVKAALETWLAPDNFDGAGRQKRRLADLMATQAPRPEGKRGWGMSPERPDPPHPALRATFSPRGRREQPGCVRSFWECSPLSPAGRGVGVRGFRCSIGEIRTSSSGPSGHLLPPGEKGTNQGTFGPFAIVRPSPRRGEGLG